MYIIKFYKYINNSFGGEQEDVTSDITGLSPDVFNKISKVSSLNTDNFETSSFFKQAPLKGKIEIDLTTIDNSNIILSHLYYPKESDDGLEDLSFVIYYSNGESEDYSNGDIIDEETWINEGSISENREVIVTDLSKIGVQIEYDNIFTYKGLLNKGESKINKNILTISIVDGLYIFKLIANHLLVSGQSLSSGYYVNVRDNINQVINYIEDKLDFNLDYQDATSDESNDAVYMYEDNVLFSLEGNSNYLYNFENENISDWFIRNGDYVPVYSNISNQLNFQYLFELINGEESFDWTPLCLWRPTGNKCLIAPPDGWSKSRFQSNISIKDRMNQLEPSVIIFYKMYELDTGHWYIAFSFQYIEYWKKRYAGLQIFSGWINIRDAYTLSYVSSGTSNPNNDSNNWDVYHINNLMNDIKLNIGDEIIGTLTLSSYEDTLSIFEYNEDGVIQSISSTYIHPHPVENYVEDIGLVSSTKYTVIYNRPFNNYDIINYGSIDNSETTCNLSIDILDINSVIIIGNRDNILETIKPFLFINKYALISNNDFNIKLIDRVRNLSPNDLNIVVISKSFERIALYDSFDIAKEIKDQILYVTTEQTENMNQIIDTIANSFYSQAYRTKIEATVLIVDNNYNLLANQLDYYNSIIKGEAYNMKIKLTMNDDFQTIKVNITGKSITSDGTIKISGYISEGD